MISLCAFLYDENCEHHINTGSMTRNCMARLQTFACASAGWVAPSRSVTEKVEKKEKSRKLFLSRAAARAAPRWERASACWALMLYSRERAESRCMMQRRYSCISSREPRPGKKKRASGGSPGLCPASGNTCAVYVDKLRLDGEDVIFFACLPPYPSFMPILRN